MLSTTRNRAAAFHALDKRLRPALVRRLHRFFNAQARRVVHRYLAEFPGDEPATQPPQAEELLPHSERDGLWLAVLPFMLQVILDAMDMAGSMVGLSEIDETDPRVQRLLSDARLHLAGVHDTTLNAVRTTLAEGFMRGYSPRQIAYGVPVAGFVGLAHSVAETYVNRSRLIGSTEIATARQNVAVERYQQAGVSAVYIADGYDCGLTDHDDPNKASGVVLTLIQARQYLLSHPGCSRVFLPMR